MKTGISKRAKSSSSFYVFHLHRSAFFGTAISAEHYSPKNCVDRWESKFHPSGIHYSISCHVSVSRNALKQENEKKKNFKISNPNWEFYQDFHFTNKNELLPSIIFHQTIFLNSDGDVNFWSFHHRKSSYKKHFFKQLFYYCDLDREQTFTQIG